MPREVDSRDAFLLQVQALKSAAELADELRAAIRADDAYQILCLKREDARLRKRLAQAAEPASRFEPVTDLDRALARRAADLVRSVAEADQLFEEWVHSERTGDLHGAEWSTQAIDNIPRVVEHPTISGLRGRFACYPAVIVSAGPSLDKNLHLLPRFKGRGVIFGMNQTVKATHTVGAPADFSVTVDSSNLLYHFDGLGPGSLSAVICRPGVHPAVFDLPARRIFSFSVGLPIETWVCDLLGAEGAVVRGSASVAIFCLNLATYMGCDPIILIGQDLALSPTQAYSRHAADHDHGFALSENGKAIIHQTSERKARAIPKTANRQEALVEVPGYDGGTVQTTQSMAIFRRSFERIIAGLAGQRTVINATEGGAHIPGAVQMPFAEAVTRYATRELDVERALDDAGGVGDVAERRERVLDELVIVDELLDTASRIATRCLANVDEVAARGWRPDDDARLRAEDRRFVKALTPIVELFSLVLTPELREVQVGVQEMSDFQSSLELSRRIYGRAKLAIELVRPHIRGAIEAIGARLDVEGGSDEGPA